MRYIIPKHATKKEKAFIRKVKAEDKKREAHERKLRRIMRKYR